jgi:hypothetical protein
MPIELQQIPSREADICCRTPDNSSFTGSHRVEHKTSCLQQLGLRPKPEPKSLFDSVQIEPSGWLTPTSDEKCFGTSLSTVAVATLRPMDT